MTAREFLECLRSVRMRRGVLGVAGRVGGPWLGTAGRADSWGAPSCVFSAPLKASAPPAGRPGLWAWRVSRGRDRCRPGRREGAGLRLRGPVSAVDARGAGSVQRMQDKRPVKTGFIVTVQGVFY